MTNRWSRVEELYHAALALEPASRDGFLQGQCGDDSHVRNEVESLLAYETAAVAFMERPALQQAASDLARQSASNLPRQLGGYELTSLLGTGGMGEVYRARDLQLGREVAVKVLVPYLAHRPDYITRFREEARSASVLTHPNIVTIYGASEDGAVAYIAMELVSGRTLRAVLSAGAIALADSIAVARQLASALAAAHAAGVVHRDLKPENVMITAEGVVKVLDFGIAKRVDVLATFDGRAATGANAAAATQHGLILGTVGYMSPEQAAGTAATFASDQFSFGAILYEMLSGKRAFTRSTNVATLAAIINETPAPITSLDAGIATDVTALVSRCLTKEPGGRFGNTRQIVTALDRIDAALHDIEKGRLTRRHLMWLGASAAATVALGSYALVNSNPDPTVRSLAVLPFRNVSDDDAATYMCDGLTESLIRRLAPLPALAVMANSTVFALRGKWTDARAAGRQLAVDSVLTGSIDRKSGRLQIDAELVDVRSGAQLWSRSYDRSTSDLIAVQQEMVISIIEDGIHLPVTAEQRRQLARTPTADVQAYALYAQAVTLHRAGTEEDYLAARALLQEATTRDPQFALAYVSLASTFTAMALDGFEKPRDAIEHWREFSGRALALEPELPDAHAEYAAGLFLFRHAWEDAEREWRRALEFRDGQMLPDLVTAFALALWALRRTPEAVLLAREARRLDRYSLRFAVLEADLLLSSGQLDSARRLYEEAIPQLPGDQRPHFGLAEVLRQQGRFEEALDERRKGHAMAGDDVLNGVLESAKGVEGYRRVEQAAVRMELAALSARADSGAYVSPYDLARAHAQAGDTDEAFRLLARAFDERAPGLVFLNVDRAWDRIRADPRFMAQVRQVNLPAA
ncbi:MAG: protein kinase [Vicinamibacterales bacterium]